MSNPIAPFLATESIRSQIGRPPSEGWLRAVREALGLSRQAVADKLEVTQAAVRDYELAETRETISLATLRRGANALGCDVVVALVPKKNRSSQKLAASAPATPVGSELLPAPFVDDSGELESHLK